MFFFSLLREKELSGMEKKISISNKKQKALALCRISFSTLILSKNKSIPPKYSATCTCSFF